MIFTRSRVVKILCTLWIFAVFSGSAILIFGLLYKKEFDFIFLYANATLVSIDAILLAVSAFSFVYLFSQVRSILLKINQNSTRQSEGTSVKVTLSKKLKIPVVILATYFVFNLTGDVFHYLHLKKQMIKKDYQEFSTLQIWSNVLWCLGLISDALIDVFMQPNIRA